MVGAGTQLAFVGWLLDRCARYVPVGMEAPGGLAQRCVDPIHGGVAQLVEHLVCNQGVVGSSPIASTSPPLPGSGSSRPVCL